MTGELRRFSRDPNWKGRKITFKVGSQSFRLTKDRGAGLYYHRGNGYFSKRDRMLDAKRTAKNKYNDRKNLHTHDLKKKSKRGWV